MTNTILDQALVKVDENCDKLINDWISYNSNGQTYCYAEKLEQKKNEINYVKSVVVNLLNNFFSIEYTINLSCFSYSEDYYEIDKPTGTYTLPLCKEGYNANVNFIIDIDFKNEVGVNFKDELGKLQLKLSNNECDFYGCSKQIPYYYYCSIHDILPVDIIYEQIKDQVETQFKEVELANFTQYVKKKNSRLKTFQKNAPKIAMKKITKYIYDNKLDFSKEELKAIIPLMIVKQEDLAILVKWFDRNKSLRDKFTDETIDQIADNITIMDILE